jgi:hypothetical protein
MTLLTERAPNLSAVKAGKSATKPPCSAPKPRAKACSDARRRGECTGGALTGLPGSALRLQRARLVAGGGDAGVRTMAAALHAAEAARLKDLVCNSSASPARRRKSRGRSLAVTARQSWRRNAG